MANNKHIKILKQGVATWNKWRLESNEIPNLQEAKLSKINLSQANLSSANLYKADLTETNLCGADFTDANLHQASLSDAKLIEANFNRADLSNATITESYINKSCFNEALLSNTIFSNSFLNEANFLRAELYEADLSGADLSGANFREAYLYNACLRYADLNSADLSDSDLRCTDLTGANLSDATLTDADLRNSILVETNLRGARLSGAFVYGISAWNVRTSATTEQNNLIITRYKEPIITVDNIKVAQFIYLLLNNKEIRNIIDTVSQKLVLILGRFTKERKAVLDAIREELRKKNYIPILFDFDGPDNRDVTETVSTLAHMSRYVIADLTDAKSIPQELTVIIPNLPSVPIKPILHSSEREYGMFEHFKKFPWVLEIYHYNDLKHLVESLDQEIITPAEKRALLQTCRS